MSQGFFYSESKTTALTPSSLVSDNYIMLTNVRMVEIDVTIAYNRVKSSFMRGRRR